MQDDPGGGSSNANVGITLQGGLFSREDIRGLIEQINDEIGDGASLAVAA